MPGLTALDATLLGLLDQAAQSGYDLRRAFVQTPLKHFSQSPGAIYPALRRLEKRGLVAAVTAARRGGRRRRALRITAAGRRALAAWVGQPLTRADVVWRMDELALRFAFMEQTHTPARALRFLADLEREVRAYLAELRRYRASAAPAMSRTGLLAFDSGVAGYEGQARWAQVAAKTLKQRRSR
jgi:DNA-binding PadR family transcriptional regulator